MGALMASGKEVLGRIPSGKLFDFEAMTTASPDRFSKTVKSWMNLKSLPSWYQNLPSVSETFQLTRTMIEVLNTDSSSHCPKKS
ncbi:tetratricopeptide repeat protein 13-like [Sinocyclocheilus rhinocerous]|nr:PREDICTED: tetratricopeptide repeat protein 13-like [Sinocyclocheilus rhinocerous]